MRPHPRPPASLDPQLFRARWETTYGEARKALLRLPLRDEDDRFAFVASSCAWLARRFAHAELRSFAFDRHLGTGRRYAVAACADVSTQLNLRCALRVAPITERLTRQQFAAEVAVAKFLTRLLLDARVSPAVPRLYDAFYCEAVEGSHVPSAWSEYPHDRTARPIAVMSIEVGVGNLRGHVARFPGYPSERTVACLLCQLAHAFAAFEALRVRHVDVNPLNVVVVSSTERDRAAAGALRYGDRVLDPYGKQADVDPVRLCVTGVAERDEAALAKYGVGRLEYAAPEFFFEHASRAHTAASEVYSLGLIALYVTFRDDLLLLDAPPGDFVRRLEALGHSGHAALALWNAVYALGLPTNRDWPGVETTSTWRALKQHGPTGAGWLTSPVGERNTPAIAVFLGPHGASLVLRMLAWDPTARPSAAEALQSPFFDQLIVPAAEAAGREAWALDPEALVRNRNVGSDRAFVARTASTDAFVVASVPSEILDDADPADELATPGERCGWCHGRGALLAPLMRCSNCRRQAYCSDVCQRRDWSVHRCECV
jgi:serine/threonine protein kinase